MKKIPMRTCVVTKERLPKKDLLRIVKNNEGKVFVDVTGKQNGHGVYIKKDMDTLLKAQKGKTLERALETTIDERIYEDIKNIIEM